MARQNNTIIKFLISFLFQFGMGMNLQYALDDYGLAKNNAVIAIWAQQTKTGDDGSGTGGDGYSCKVTLTCKDRNGNVNGYVSCSGKEKCLRDSFFGSVTCDGKETVCN